MNNRNVRVCDIAPVRASAEGVPGCRVEFLAYRILYQAVHAKHGEILQLLNTLKRVTREVGLTPVLMLRAAAAAVLAAVGAVDAELVEVLLPLLCLANSGGLCPWSQRWLAVATLLLPLLLPRCYRCSFG